MYYRHPMVNHLVTVCPKCQTKHTLWELDETLIDNLLAAIARDAGINIKIEAYASRRVWDKFLVATGQPNPWRPLPPEKAQSADKEVRFFRYLLDAGVFPQ